MENFTSKFETDFHILETNSNWDEGSFGTFLKVFPKNKELTTEDVLAIENPQYCFVSRNIAAIKIIPSSIEEIEKTKREAEILSKLEDPNIIKIKDFWIEFPPINYRYKDLPGLKITNTSALLFLQMEYADRKSLRHWLTSDWKNKSDGNKIKYYIASGLSYLHQKGIIHRDLKPENVVISTSHSGAYSFIKICDFGLAVNVSSKIENGSSFTKKIGTEGYIAPEMMINDVKYTDKVDIYSLGVIFAEIAVACIQENKGLKSFWSYLQEEESYPLNPFIFHKHFPQLLLEEDFILENKMTSLDPDARPSSAELPSLLTSKYGRAVSDLLPFYHDTPNQIKISGTSEHLVPLTSFPAQIILQTLKNKMDPQLVTTVELINVNINPLSVASYIEPMKNLEHLEIIAENSSKGGIPFFRDTSQKLPLPTYGDVDISPHPKLKSFKFHQLNYKDTFQNSSLLNETLLSNVMFFIPHWPSHQHQLWRNRMSIDIKFGAYYCVQIDPQKGYFRIDNFYTRTFVSVLSFSDFNEIKIRHLNESLASLSGKYKGDVKAIQIAFQDDQICFEPYSVLSLTKLYIKNTTVNLLCRGRIFTKFVNLQELTYDGPNFHVARNRFQQFEIDRLPRNLRRIKLESVKLLTPSKDWEGKFDLESLMFSMCQFEEGFMDFLKNRVITNSLWIAENPLESRPNFCLLKKLWDGNWNELFVSELDWRLTNDTDFDASIMKLFKDCKISANYPNLKFKKPSVDRPEGNVDKFKGVKVVQLTTAMEELVDFTNRAPRLDGLTLKPSKMQFEPVKVDDLSDDEKLFFDGGTPSLKDGKYIYPTLGRLQNKIKVKEIEIRHTQIGNIVHQLLGCKNLESLILNNVQWTVSTLQKAEFPLLKTYRNFEDLGALGEKLSYRISLDKINMALFFCENGFQGLWKLGINVIISVNTRMNFVIDHNLEQLRLQSIDGSGAQQLMSEVGIDSSLQSLVLAFCEISDHSIIPSHLTSLYIHEVNGIQFSDIILPSNRFPNLRKLYYETHKHNMQELDLKDVPQNLDTLLLGGLSIVNVSTIVCKHLTFSNCLFCSDFFETYPKNMKAEKLLFLGGSIRSPNIEEISPLMLANELNWVGFGHFIWTTDYKYFYDQQQKVTRKVLLSPEIAAKGFETMKWLKSVSESDQQISESGEFVLERENGNKNWKYRETDFDEFHIISGIQYLALP